MKLLAVVLCSIAICAGNAVPKIPGDNRGYQPGDRYVWMPDGRGVPQLADLHATVEPVERDSVQSGIRYFLYTRSNPTTRREIFKDDVNSVLNAGLQLNRPVNVIVHGWNGDANSDVNVVVTAAFLQANDDNVIVVDWGHVANGLYITASSYTPSIGIELGSFLFFLADVGVPFSNMHLVGFSLGAHLVGVAGRIVRGQVSRITGLEPAGPGWGITNPYTLHHNDAVYVESIHTDAGTLSLWDAVGDATFYPNGGNEQPGCWLSSCSHSRVWSLFASSVATNHLWGRQCESLTQAQNSACTGVTFPMGNGVIGKRGSGIYFVVTTSSWPF